MITLPQMQGQEKSYEDNSADWVLNEITALGEAFGEGLTAERQAIYVRALADIPKDELRRAIRLAVKHLKWFPKVAELRELARGLPDAAVDRPGPEEAWARMPKGEHREDDSVVWCEEERAAYSSCRSLLLDGDQIGARMAFKERYEKEVAEAHAAGKPVRWIMSAGFDMNHRLSTLATAVQEKRMTLEGALNFVPGERQSDFAQMLPPKEAKGLLTGKIEKLPDIPGLGGVLAKMRMEDLVPEELESLRPYSEPRPEPTAEDLRKRRDDLKHQIELITRSRNGPNGSGA